MIPNIKNFNDVEENFLKDNLVDMCFKDTVRKNHQDNLSTNNLKNDSVELAVGNGSFHVNNNVNNNGANNIISEDNEYLQRKKNRNEKNSSNDSNRKNGTPSAKKVDADGDEKIGKGVTTVGIKLICESDNEDLKKYFSKTVNLFFLIISRNSTPTMTYL